jgi:hypothetical protein
MNIWMQSVGSYTPQAQLEQIRRFIWPPSLVVDDRGPRAPSRWSLPDPPAIGKPALAAATRHNAENLHKHSEGESKPPGRRRAPARERHAAGSALCIY